MKFTKIIIILILIPLMNCVGIEKRKSTPRDEKIYYSSSGFALIYEDSLYSQKILNKKINKEEIQTIHSLLKTNTPIKIINPSNSKFIETKIYKKAKYPKIFTIVISEKIASILELDIDNPFVEVVEVKKNKTFIAKKSNTFDEE